MDYQSDPIDQNTEQVKQPTAVSVKRKINPWMLSTIILFAALLFSASYIFNTLNKKVNNLTLDKDKVENIVTGRLRVKFKSDVEMKDVISQLSVLGLQLPPEITQDKKVKTTLLATPHRTDAKFYGQKLKADPQVLNVDFTYTDELLSKYKERIREDTAYLWVTFKAPLSWSDEEKWLLANYPDLVDVGRKQVDNSTVEIAVVNINSGQESFGNRENPWYSTSITEIEVPDGKETYYKAKLKSLDLFESVELVKPYVGPGPICLDSQAKISTPQGEVIVKNLVVGMLVWTSDNNGNRIVGAIKQVSKTPVPTDFKIIHLVLADGRELRASPKHPLSDWRLVGDIKQGDHIEGVEVTNVESLVYNQNYTYDILPSGNTGEYWANGILLRSTLKSSY